MSNIFNYIVIALMAILGGGATIYIMVSLPAMLIWKAYWAIRYGKSFFD